MEEAPENGKESSHSAHAKGMNEHITQRTQTITECPSAITQVSPYYLKFHKKKFGFKLKF